MSVDFFHSKFSSIWERLRLVIRRYKNAQQIEVAELEEIQEDLTVLYTIHSHNLSFARREADHARGVKGVPFIGQINETDKEKWKKKSK